MLYAYSQFRVFGCLYYAHITKEGREKFDAKARKCVMLGYGFETKAYWLYDLERRKHFSVGMYCLMSYGVDWMMMMVSHRTVNLVQRLLA